MTIFKTNLKRGHKFLMSGMMFGFCMARIVTCSLRIAWANHPHDLPLSITASIFVNLGVILLYAINLIFTQRIVRASHPNFGWHKLFSIVFRFLYVSIVLFVIMLVVPTVDSFYTLDKVAKLKDRRVTLVGSVWFAMLAFLPILFVVFGIIVPKKSRVDKFGEGRFRHKIWILLIAATLLTLGASFRSGVAFMARPINHPAWFHSRASFYCFNFVIEFSVIVLYAVLRVDRRFHIPDGSRFTYSKHALGKRQSRVMTEEEVFDDVRPDDEERHPGSEDISHPPSMSQLRQV
jgi:hypothetical protein